MVLKLGTLLYKLGRAKVAVFLKNQTNMERPSDIQGLIYLPFSDNVEEAKVHNGQHEAEEATDGGRR